MDHFQEYREPEVLYDYATESDNHVELGQEENSIDAPNDDNPEDPNRQGIAATPTAAQAPTEPTTRHNPTENGRATANDLAAVLSTFAEIQSAAHQRPLPLPKTEGMPWFEGHNVTEWIEGLEHLKREYRMTEEDFRLRIPMQAERSLGDQIKSMKEWEIPFDWEKKFKPAMVKEHFANDRYQQMYTKEFLLNYSKTFKNKAGTQEEILTYTRKFNQIAQKLIKDKAITKSEVVIMFLRSVPSYLATKCVRVCKVDATKPASMSWDPVCKFFIEYADFSRQLDVVLADDEESKTKMEGLVNEFTPSIKKKDLKVGAPVVEANSDIVALTKSLSDFTLVMTQTVMDRIAPKKTVTFDITRPEPANRAGNVPGLVYTTTHVDSDDETVEEVNAQSGSWANRKCYYCQNREPGKLDHTLKAECPVMAQHIEDGYIHHNLHGVLCWGRPGDDRKVKVALLPKERPQAHSVELHAQASKWGKHGVEANTIDIVPHDNSVNNLRDFLRTRDNVSVNAATTPPATRGRPPGTFTNPTRIMKRPSEPVKTPLTNAELIIQQLTQGKDAQLPPQSAPPAESPRTVEVQMENGEDGDFPIVYEKVPEGRRRRKKMVAEATTFASESLPEMSRRILNLRVELSLGTILQYAPALWKQWTYRVDDPTRPEVMTTSLVEKINKELDTPFTQIDDTNLIETVNNVRDINNVVAQPPSKTREELPHINVSVGGMGKVRAIPDSGSTINLMSLEVAQRLKLPISPVDVMIAGPTNNRVSLTGICQDVEVSLGGVSNKLNIYVLAGARNTLLLGMPWFLAGEVVFAYQDGAQYLTITDDNGEDRASVWCAGRSTTTPYDQTWAEN